MSRVCLSCGLDERTADCWLSNAEGNWCSTTCQMAWEDSQLTRHSGVTDAMLGIRLDDGKPRMDLLPGDALLSVADVFTEGAKKYSDRNWEKGMAWHKLFSPIERHLWKWWQGEETDEESGQHHLAHAACDCLMLLASVMRGIGEDDRPGRNT